MHWLTGCKSRIETDVALSRITSFGVGGPARWLAHPESPDGLAEVLRRSAENGVPMKVLGRGANVLVRDSGFAGVVIRLDAPCFKTEADDDGGRRVGAGVDLYELTKRCARTGMSGLEPIAGIPGTVGGAVRMNAGGRFGEFSDVVVNVDTMDSSGRRECIEAEDMGYGYRHSALGSRVVLSALLRLEPDDPVRTAERFRDVWESKRASQPFDADSAGCVFKNPPGASAGRLIDKAGMKGFQFGGAAVSTKHANFIITQAGASASDVCAVINAVRDAVLRVFGVELELEVDLW